MNSSDASAPLRAVVIGGGIAGLTAAYRLHTIAESCDKKLELTLLEASDRFGGVIKTEAHDGLVIERGPESLVTEKPWGLELCRELGLEDEIIPTTREHAGSFVAHGNRLHPLPEGFHLMAPSRFWPFATTRLLTIGGKLRMAADIVIPRRDSNGDESLGAFVRRRLGREALERVAQPMVGGIYSADPDRLSLRATMPRFLDMEHKYGSVIRGMLAARRARDSAASARGPRYDLFVSLTNGLEDIPRELARRLPKETLHTGCRVSIVHREANTWRIECGEHSYVADALCIATPSYVAATMLRTVTPELADELDAIEHSSSATVNLVYRREDVPAALSGFGFVVPAIERRTVMACTFSSFKYRGRSPEDKILLRAFVGGALAPENFSLDDQAMASAVQHDLSQLSGLSAAPIETVISRYPRSMPQYHVGHLDRMDRIDAQLSGLPGLSLAGNAYRGTGLPDCIRSGNSAAHSMASLLGLSPPTD